MGRHFLQIPGPTNCPDEVLRAISAATIDHRGPEFQALGKSWRTEQDLHGRKGCR
jgi:alanine-glyoxylate transaminase/serine-glyoxylate transaminase/serine-pyruvate transaminase